MNAIHPKRTVSGKIGSKIEPCEPKNKFRVMTNEPPIAQAMVVGIVQIISCFLTSVTPIRRFTIWKSESLKYPANSDPMVAAVAANSKFTSGIFTNTGADMEAAVIIETVPEP